MKKCRRLAIIAAVFTIIAVFASTVSAQEYYVPSDDMAVFALDQTVIYPDYENYNMMKNSLPKTEGNSHIIVFDIDNNVGVITFDNSEGAVRTFTFNSSNYSEKLYFFQEGAKYNYYTWDYDKQNWNYKYDPNEQHEGVMAFGTEEMLIYTDYTIYNNYGSSWTSEKPEKIAFTAGYQAPAVATLKPTWNSMGSDTFNALTAEIVSILPVVICFIVLELSIHKGISFLFGFLRSA